jgi:amphi-Trp domain-containing protein
MRTTTSRSEETSMGKDKFEFARIATPEEIAEYLTSLAVGLKRGEVSLESGERTLRLAPGPDMRLEIKVAQKEHKGKLELEIGWKRQAVTKAPELRVAVGPRAGR